MSIKAIITSELKKRDIKVKDVFKPLGVSRQGFYNKLKEDPVDPQFLTKIKDVFGISIENFDNSQSDLMVLKKNKRNSKALIPFYNADFMAGNADVFYDDGTIYPEYYMDVPEFYGCTAFRAYSDSMEKKIKSGSILFGVKLDDWRSHLEYGQIYGITCTDGRRYLKYIRRIKGDNNQFLLRSENENYDDFELPKEKVKNIWLIEGWIDKRI